jgi:integrase
VKKREFVCKEAAKVVFMHISLNLWEKFRIYLLSGLKFRNHDEIKYAYRSRFFILCEYFKNKEFNKENLRIFLEEKRAGGAKPNYLNKFIVTAKHLGELLGSHEFEKENYFFVGDTYYQIFSQDDINKICSVVIPYKRCPNELNLRHQTFFECLSITGARQMELRNLEWCDVIPDFPRLRFRNGKNGHTREVPINQYLFNKLYELPRRSNFVFTTCTGHRLDSKELRIDLHKRCKATGIVNPDSRCHLFRHTVGTTLGAAGANAQFLSKYLGHQNMNSTMKYINPLLEDLLSLSYLLPWNQAHLKISEITDLAYKLVKRLISKSFYNITMEELNGDPIIRFKKIPAV